MPYVSMVHVVAGFLALGSGAGILFYPKGTRTHKAAGYVYVTSMVALNATALFIYRVFHTFGPFHVLALVSLASVIMGLIPARRRQPGWLKRHYDWMSWSYCGLCAAAIAELGTHPPFAYPALLRAVFAFVMPPIVFLLGRRLLVKNRPRFLAAFAGR